MGPRIAFARDSISEGERPTGGPVVFHLLARGHHFLVLEMAEAPLEGSQVMGHDHV